MTLHTSSSRFLWSSRRYTIHRRRRERPSPISISALRDQGSQGMVVGRPLSKPHTPPMQATWRVCKPGCHDKVMGARASARAQRARLKMGCESNVMSGSRQKLIWSHSVICTGSDIFGGRHRRPTRVVVRDAAFDTTVLRTQGAARQRSRPCRGGCAQAQPPGPGRVAL